MPVVDYKKYCAMLDNAKKNKFAYPAINVTSEITANAVLEAFAETRDLVLIRNARNAPNRAFRWDSPVSRLIQIYSDNAQYSAWTFW